MIFSVLFLMLVIFVFFFQAEDGIRDWSVTGVQTCALPICRCGSVQGVIPNNARSAARYRAGVVQSCGWQSRTASQRAEHAHAADRFAREIRSEERRVGKECRAQRSPARGIKKERRHVEGRR